MKIFRIGLVVSALAFAGVGVFNCGGSSDSGDAAGGSAGSSSGGGGSASGGGGGSASGGSGGAASGGSGGAASGGSGGAAMGGKGGGGAGGTGGAGGAGGAMGGAGGTPAVLTFKTDIYPIIMTKCSGCHWTAITDVDKAWTYVTSTTTKCDKYTGKKRVVADKPEDSLFYAKVKGGDTLLPATCGGKMPAGQAAVSDADAKKIEDWIKAGATKG